MASRDLAENIALAVIAGCVLGIWVARLAGWIV